jgi:hypothetical protein
MYVMRSQVINNLIIILFRIGLTIFFVMSLIEVCCVVE